MKSFPFQLLTVALVAVTPCYAQKSVVRDGSTKEKAIILKQRGTKAVEEEMAWMMKMHKSTPIKGMEDLMLDAVRQLKTGQKKTVNLQHPWEHAILDHGGQCCSYWEFKTPRGRKGMYFDTGVSINIEGEVARQLMYRIDYITKRLPKTVTIPR
jgi:hypothetical protein